MIYTEMTEKALEIAWKAHAGQVDRAGLPYIFHPFYLAEQMDDEISCTVALLHDVIEDSSYTADDLRKIFPEEVVDAIILLTHEESVDYFEYVENLKHNALARRVKLADLAHNSDRSRIRSTVVDADVEEKRYAKYEKARRILLE